MRIVSLLPAATEWLFALGAGDRVVGRSHACDAPPDAQALPVVTAAAVPGRADAAAIDAAVRDALEAGLSLFVVDLDRLRALRPDLIVTQTTCAVCAVEPSALAAALDADLGAAVFDFAPATYKQVLDQALRLGRTVGHMAAAMQVLGEGEVRLRTLHQRIGYTRAGRGHGPRTAVLEWVDPPMTAGHWTPDLIALAGGQPVLGEAGGRSADLRWDALQAADPEVLVVAACGRSVEDTLADLPALTDRPDWDALRAVRDGRVFVLDGNAYVNRPGPRLVRSVELLAAAIHGNAAGITPEPEALRRVEPAAARSPSRPPVPPPA